MSREQLVADARAAGRAARQKLEWMKKNPDRFDQSKREDMEVFLKSMIRFSEEEMKNARLAGRTSLRNRLKYLVVSILAYKEPSINAKRMKKAAKG